MSDTTGPDGLRDDERPELFTFAGSRVASYENKVSELLRARLIESRAETDAERLAHAETRARAALLDRFPRCEKLLREGAAFFVVRADEPYAPCVAALIKNTEDGLGKWTAEDEQRTAAMLRTDSVEKAPPNVHRRYARAEAAIAALTARAEKAEAERDAAVHRNLMLKAEVEEERAQRMPIADYTHSVYDVIDKAITSRVNYDNSHARTVIRALEDVRTEIEKLPGWDGTEGGFTPGCEGTHYVHRHRLHKLEAERDRLRARFERMVDLGTATYCDTRKCGACTVCAARALLGEVKP